jgi:hypothetical protein
VSFLTLVDEIYETFARSLPPTLARAAGALASTLKLVPDSVGGDRAVAWSAVFKHEIVLAAPALFAEAVPDVPSRVVREAVRAHLLGVLHAFAVDRVQDGEARASASTLALTDALRDARDRALGLVIDGAPKANTPRGFPDDDTTEAVLAEQACLARAEATDFAVYLDLSRRKQGAAAPASAALALAAGWPPAEVMQVHELFEALALGLQMYDDAVDWPKDLTQGRAWAASLLGVARLPPAEASARIRQGDVLFRLVDGGREQFARGEALARAMQATSIAEWASERRQALTRVAREEQRSPGYAAREQELGGWLHEVLR